MLADVPAAELAVLDDERMAGNIQAWSRLCFLLCLLLERYNLAVGNVRPGLAEPLLHPRITASPSFFATTVSVQWVLMHERSHGPKLVRLRGAETSLLPEP